VSDKLDRLVATRVMGWKIIVQPDDCEGYPEIYNSGNAVCRWRPSHRIDDAMDVHEKLRLCILAIRMPDGSDGWQVRRWIGSFDASSTNHKSLCMAICLAALRAVGVPEATIQEACK